MRIIAFVCLLGLGCSGGSTTSENKPAQPKAGADVDNPRPETKVEPKSELTKEELAEKQKNWIEKAKRECDEWEKAVLKFQFANNDAYPADLKAVANYVKDGKDKLRSPWGTPYVMEVDRSAVLPEMRVTTTTDNHQLITKKGVEKK